MDMKYVRVLVGFVLTAMTGGLGLAGCSDSGGGDDAARDASTRDQEPARPLTGGSSGDTREPDAATIGSERDGGAVDACPSHSLAEVCERVSCKAPADVLSSPRYACSEEYPSLPNDSGLLYFVFEYSEGCGLGHWYQRSPAPPNHSVTWELETGRVVGAAYVDDVKPPGCATNPWAAGQRFDCNQTQRELYCLGLWTQVYVDGKWTTVPIDASGQLVDDADAGW